MESPRNPLANQVAVVTGGTRGIGRAIAKMLLEEGSRVVICGRSADAVETAVVTLQQETQGKVKGKVADVRSYGSVAELFRFVDQEFGGELDVLVNSAGIGLFRPVAELSIQDWQDTIETNLSGVFYSCREALQRMGIGKPGYIINISSLAGKHPFAGGAAYNASKFGLNGLTEAMMLDSRSHNVRVSSISPGSVDTGFSGKPEAVSDWKIWPEDIAEIVRTMLRMPERSLISSVEVRPSRPKR